MAYKKIETYDEQVTNNLAGLYKSVIAELGENPEREGLEKTPERMESDAVFNPGLPAGCARNTEQCKV